MNVDCVIGIDPGVGGGLSIWRPNQFVEVKKMPAKLMDLISFFEHIKEITENPIVFIEKVQQLPSDAIGGKFMRTGALHASMKQLKEIMEYVDMPFILVHPISWQAYLNLRRKNEEKKDRKNRYKEAAQLFYPEVKATLWSCDALLLMHFGRKKLKNDVEWILSNLPAKLHGKLD